MILMEPKLKFEDDEISGSTQESSLKNTSKLANLEQNLSFKSVSIPLLKKYLYSTVIKYIGVFSRLISYNKF